MYDKPLLKLMYEGSLEEIGAKVAPGDYPKGLANAQNANGETVLMKCCRRALYTPSRSPLAVVSLLLKHGADPMVCCDSGKNVLHDLFWSAKPPPADVLHAMETMVGGPRGDPRTPSTETRRRREEELAGWCGLFGAGRGTAAGRDVDHSEGDRKISDGRSRPTRGADAVRRGRMDSPSSARGAAAGGWIVRRALAATPLPADG